MRRAAHLAWITVALVGCGDPSSSTIGADDNALAELLQLPPGFPLPAIPESNRLSAEKIELGRHLFYDVRLSANQNQSCASCHEQARAFADGRVTPVGSTGERLIRNSQGLSNVAYNANLTWANPLLDSLEQQILVPIFSEHPVELGATGNENEILARLQNDAEYPAMFEAAFEDSEIDWGNIVFALASFSRSLISGNSPFDRFAYQGDSNALSASAQAGIEVFFSETTECHHCHGGFNFTLSTLHENSVFEAEDFHNTGLYNLDESGSYPPGNTGVHDVTGDPEDMGKFRAPSLRNVALTAPYMHDGSIETLEEVIRTYEAGGREVSTGPFAGDGRANPHKSGFVQGFTLTDQEREDLIAFLESLTDTQFTFDPRFSDPFSQ